MNVFYEVEVIKIGVIQKVTSVYFRQLMLERGRPLAASHDLLTCKSSHNWLPSVVVVSIDAMIILPAAKFVLFSAFFTQKT
jgi:hypothetical protein